MKRLLVVLAACGHPSEPRAPAIATVGGAITIGPEVDAKLARAGTLLVYWMTRAENQAVLSGSLDLTPAQHMLDHLVVIGPVDLSAPGATTTYSVPVDAPDVVMSAVLDTQHDAIGALLGAHANFGAGDLMGDGKPVHVAGATTSDIVLDQVVTAEPEKELCTGPRHELVVLDAPEVAGTMGNDPHRRVCVVLPASYATSPERRYPVVYELPGWGADDAHMMNPIFQHDALFTAAAPEAILAIIDTSTKAGSSYIVDSPHTGQWEHFLTATVVPAIDQRYRTIAKRDGRATAGLSTGGFDSLTLGLRHPELFGVVTASSPDGPDITKWLFNEPDGPVPAWSLAMLRVEAATGGAGFFASYGNDWSPDDSTVGFALPLDLATGKPVPEVIARWRSHGPSAWFDDPRQARAFVDAFDNRVCLSVGKRDEFGLYQTTRAFSTKIAAAGLHHQIDYADGGHIDPKVMSLVFACAAQKLAH